MNLNLTKRISLYKFCDVSLCSTLFQLSLLQLQIKSDKNEMHDFIKCGFWSQIFEEKSTKVGIYTLQCTHYTRLQSLQSSVNSINFFNWKFHTKLISIPFRNVCWHWNRISTHSFFSCWLLLLMWTVLFNERMCSNFC